MQWILVVLIVCVFVATVDAFTGPAAFGARVASSSSRLHADVEIVFPNNKKVKVAGGSAMKDGTNFLLFYFILMSKISS